MAVAIDYSQRLYLVVSMNEDTVTLLERCSAGPDELRRNQGELESIGVRHIPFNGEMVGDTKRRGFVDLFDIVENISGGELVKKWMESNNWPVTDEARKIINRVIYIEDSVEYLRYRAETRNREKVLARAERIRQRGDRHVDDSVPEKYVIKTKQEIRKELAPKKKKKHFFTFKDAAKKMEEKASKKAKKRKVIPVFQFSTSKKRR